MVAALGPRETRALLRRHDLRPRTAIGQHFVTDANTTRKVAALAQVGPGDLVIEVGPGLGALSLAILETGADLVAIERDRGLRPALEEVLDGRAEVVWDDATRIRYQTILKGRTASLVANLPYQIAAGLIVDLLCDVPGITRHVVMVQREVGERLAAAPGTASYGAVSAKVAYLAEASVVSRVSRRVFYPTPEVESVVVRLDRRPRPPVRGGRARIFAVIAAGFAQRRKTIRRALVGGGWTQASVEEALDAAGVDGRARAETLGLDAFAALARALPERAR